MYESPDGEYGRMQPDKSWTGVIKELIDGVIIFFSLYLFFFSMYHVLQQHTKKMLKNINMNEMIETTYKNEIVFSVCNYVILI